MLDIKYIRSNPEIVSEALEKRNAQISLDEFLDLDKQRREFIQEVEQLKNKRNTVSQEIARLKREKKDAEPLIAEMGQVSRDIKELDDKVREVDEQLKNILMIVPNIPHESVPVGNSDEDNKEIRSWGSPTEFNFEPKPIGILVRI